MKDWQQSIGREKAIELYDSHWWELCDYEDIAKFQLWTAELCCPFSVFQEAMEKTLNRPVWTHEFGMDIERLRDEMLGKREMPSLAEIIGLIPEEKRVIVIKEESE